MGRDSPNMLFFITLGDGIVTGTYTYTVRDWMKEAHYTAVFRDSLGYDPVGNITAQKYRHSAETERMATYDYDGLHRLTDFDLSPDDYSQDFAYDLNGNITSRTTDGATLTYNYGSTPNRLDSTTGTGGTSFTYNDNGWMTGRGGGAGDTFAYDYRGLLTGYNSDTYINDTDGNRVKKAVAGGGETVYYIRGADGSVLAEYDGSGQLAATYVYAHGRRIAQVVGGVPQYYLHDHLGSTRAVVMESGQTPTIYNYWPYGATLVSTADTTRYKFTGYEHDLESGLYYTPARMYDPVTGRMLRPDPRFSSSPHLSPYSYGPNNPLSDTDPSGEIWITAEDSKSYWIDVPGNTYYDDGTVEENTFADYPRGLDQGPLYFAENYGASYLYHSRLGLGAVEADPTHLIEYVFIFAGVKTAVSSLADDGVKWVSNLLKAIKPSLRDQKGLRSNPFKGKTPQQIEKMLVKRGYIPKGPDPLNGKGSYLNPKTGRSIHIDANHLPPKPPHVSVQRPRDYRNLPQREYLLEE